MANKAYEEYTNYSTFAVALNSDNERAFYNSKLEWFNLTAITCGFDTPESVTPLLPRECHNFARRTGLLRHCRTTDPDFNASLVDWSDIAETWTIQLREHIEYM